MQADAARKWTDKRLEEMEKEIRDIYKEANKNITAEWNKYMERGQKRLATLYEEMESMGTPEYVEKYQQALRQYTIYDDRYRNMVNDTARRMANANQIAIDYMNGQLPQIYEINYNQASEFGFNFTLIDEATIRRRIMEGDIRLPNKALDIPKDLRWNTKQLNSSVIQGILQGESMDKIARRIEPVVDHNADAAIRNARTMVTGAENVGRLDSYKKLEDDGVIIEKVWMATNDDRTREAHAWMDGQTAENDEPFIDGDGNELMYPGDPDADGSTVYNCRCSMHAKISGFIPRSRR